jgi:hypothetical protein
MPERQTEILEEMLNWIRFMGMNEARDVIDDALSYEDDEKKERSARIAYELTDGTNSTTDIEDYIDYSYRWVSRRQMEWAKLGIVDKPGENRSYEHLASLTELGLDCPEIPDPDADEEQDADTAKESESDGSEDSSDEAGQPTLEDSVAE